MPDLVLLTPSASPVHQVRQHNALTTAHYNYTELQMDLMIFLLSKLRQTKDNLSYTLPLHELSQLTGKQYNYNYLQTATKDMGSRMFKVKTQKQLEQIWMFQKITYLNGQGVIEVKLSEDILPYLFDLKNNFTSYEIEAFLKLTGKYSKRLYQLCSQWKDRNATPIYELQELKEMLGLIDDKGAEVYLKYGDLKVRALNSSIKQINQLTDLSIELVEEKKGRAVGAVGFKIKMKPYALTIQFPNTDQPAPAPEGISHIQYDSAERVLEEVRIVDPKIVRQILSSSDLVRQVLKFSHDLRTSKVKSTSNPGGLLLTILGLAAPKRARKS